MGGAGFYAKLLGPLALLCATPLVTGAAGPTATWQERVLSEQNRERAALGLPPLRWNNALAGAAEGWADHLATTGAFEHAPENSTNPEGENLWAGTRGYYSPEAMVGGWLAEKRDFRPGVFPNVSRTGRVADVGHYTQIVWRNSGDVGCALTHSSSEDLLVCRYSEAGNWIGERPY